MKHVLDLPPVWLALALCGAWVQGRYMPVNLSLDHPVTQAIAWGLIGAGVILIGAAALEFRRARTTIIPHQTPRRLIRTGVFARSRNPIYLGDVLILSGFILHMDALPSLILVPLFVWWISMHFIGPEEQRLRSMFGPDFDAYSQKVRRWV